MTFKTGGNWLLLLVTAALLTATIAACSDGDDGNGGASPTAGATGVATGEVLDDNPASTVGPASAPGAPSGGQAAPPSPLDDRPPSTTASANGVTVEMGIGTYCWTTMCVDTIGVTTKGTLTLSRGDTVSVAVPSAAPPLREASAGVIPAANSMPLSGGGEVWPYGGPPQTPLGYAVSGQTVEVEVDLPPGKHILALGMYFDRGDVVYGVVLDVK